MDPTDWRSENSLYHMGEVTPYLASYYTFSITHSLRHEPSLMLSRSSTLSSLMIDSEEMELAGFNALVSGGQSTGFLPPTVTDNRQILAQLTRSAWNDGRIWFPKTPTTRSLSPNARTRTRRLERRYATCKRATKNTTSHDMIYILGLLMFGVQNETMFQSLPK